jgi:hypothetical protein
MFGFGKRLTLSVALVAAGASAPVANDLDLVYGPKIQAANEALYNCMIAKTKLYARESEPATVVASAARQACWAEEGEYRRWFLHVFPAAKLESNIRSEVAENVQFVLELRAPTIPCQGPDGKAPAWAVMDEQARGKFIAEADPVWQHATCHYGRREVRWSFPQ